MYCKNCYPKIQHTPTGLGVDPGKIEADPCLAEVLGKNGFFLYRQCLSCAGCNMKLNASNFSCGPDGVIAIWIPLDQEEERDHMVP